MFVREKTINGYSYLYLVESVREDGRTKQRILKQPRPQGRGAGQRRAGTAGRVGRPLCRAGADPVADWRRQHRWFDLPADRSAAVVRPVVGGDRLPGGHRGASRRPRIRCSRSSARSSPPSCTGCSSPAPTGPARRGWPTMRSPASRVCTCTTSTVPWRGWARRRPIADGALAPAASRTSLKSSSSSGGGPVQRAVGGVHGHDDAHVRGRRWHDAGRPRPLQGPPAASTRRKCGRPAASTARSAAASVSGRPAGWGTGDTSVCRQATRK